MIESVKLLELIQLQQEQIKLLNAKIDIIDHKLNFLQTFLQDAHLIPYHPVNDSTKNPNPGSTGKPQDFPSTIVPQPPSA